MYGCSHFWFWRIVYRQKDHAEHTNKHQVDYTYERVVELPWWCSALFSFASCTDSKGGRFDQMCCTLSPPSGQKKSCLVIGPEWRSYVWLVSWCTENRLKHPSIHYQYRFRLKQMDDINSNSCLSCNRFIK